jgi:hypothetical protein
MFTPHPPPPPHFTFMKGLLREAWVNAAYHATPHPPIVPPDTLTDGHYAWGLT